MTNSKQRFGDGTRCSELKRRQCDHGAFCCSPPMSVLTRILDLPPITLLLRGTEDCQLWEISPIARKVAREQRQPFDGRVRSDVKVRKRCGPLAAPPAIAQVALAGEEAGFPRQSFSLVGGKGQGCIQGFNGAETDRYLGVDNGIDNECRTLGTLSQCARGPVGPFRVVGRDVQNNVAIDEDAAAVA